MSHVVLLSMYARRFAVGDAVDWDDVRHVDLGPDASEFEARLVKPVMERNETDDQQLCVFGTHTALEPFTALDFAFTGGSEWLDGCDFADDLEWAAVVADANAALARQSNPIDWAVETVAIRIHGTDDDLSFEWLGLVDAVIVRGETFNLRAKS